MPHKVGFIIRTKNEEAWLTTALQSLFDQTFQDFQITIIDSGSKDSTLQIVEKYQQTKGRIKLMQIPPEEFGYSRALNLAIEQTLTEYLAIISGHSVPMSIKWLASGVRILDQEPKTVAITGHYYDLPNAPLKIRVESLIPRLAQQTRKNNWSNLTNTNSLIRRSGWESYPFDENLPECEDYDWALEMLSRGWNVVLEPKFSVYHSHWHIPGAKTWEERKKVWDKICHQIDQKPRPTV